MLLPFLSFLKIIVRTGFNIFTARLHFFPTGTRASGSTLMLFLALITRLHSAHLSTTKAADEILAASATCVRSRELILNSDSFKRLILDSII